MTFFDNLGRGLAGAFKPLYPEATLIRIRETHLDDGDIRTQERRIPVKAKLENVTEAMKTDPGYASSDVAIYVLNPELSLDITTDDEIKVEGGRYKIAGPIRKDTIGSHFILRGIHLP